MRDGPSNAAPWGVPFRFAFPEAFDLSKLPALLAQAVIIPYGDTQEGTLIEAVAVPWFEIIDLMTREPSIVHQIGARKWEEIIAGAYRKAGFDEVTLTPRSRDFGRDVIAVKYGLGTIRVIE